MSRSIRAAAALSVTAALAVAVSMTAAAAHSSRPGPAYDAGYGYATIRKGIPDSAVRFTVKSPDVRDGGMFPADAWANAFGCSGGNQQIRLSWSGAPAGTRSYAVSMFDPDAPTGAGFWHWLTWDIPADDTTLGRTLPVGATAGTDDAGLTGYLGPCPPSGDVAHHYQITVYALNEPSLGLTATTPATVTAFTMSTHIIGYARITVTAQR
jgi:Raf kinase inhibitor-like YbhB/YbcL family protein